MSGFDRDIGRTRSGLRYGWTTGSCAAAAAKAAAEMLLGGQEILQVRLMTPAPMRAQTLESFRAR